ncbi:MAG: gliding motility-associated C-terminal domain-containing protein [Bacteroidales bacterium]|nr:gliding motility-associated C-terminal domain-containing protein [Bacteroidales bacterium]
MQLSKLRLILYLFLSILAYPVKGQYDFTVSDAAGCTPMKIKYSLTNTATVDSIDQVTWDFDNGETSSSIDPDSVTYDQQGSYTPTLVITFDNGYELWITKTGFIDVHRIASVSYSYKDTISDLVYVFEQTATLDAGVDYTFEWDIEGFALRTEPRPLYTFPDSGTYAVVLTVTDEFGCSSQASGEISILEEIRVQNVFTPNNDGDNDYFIVNTNGSIPINLKIFSRAGVLVYEAEGTIVSWDGYTVSGQKLRPGIYFYVMEALTGDPDGKYSKAGALYMYD